MLPPVLEIYVVWHPKDSTGASIAAEIIDHFRGTAFTGLIGGAVEVFVRSESWSVPGGAPRPIPTPGSPPPNGLKQSEFTVIVPLLGAEMTHNAETPGDWQDYLASIVVAQKASPLRTMVLPYRLDGSADHHTQAGMMLGPYQTFAANAPEVGADTKPAMRARDLSQAIAQFLARPTPVRLKAFISHTKHGGANEPGDVNALVKSVRDVLGATHLDAFFDASDLQPGSDWSDDLKKGASTSALLALRTDLYPSREWCQREMLLAKQHGMPVIILDGIGFEEERGSFLMDHVPRTPVRFEAGEWRRSDTYRAINLLVDECLKRELWRWQQKLAAGLKNLEVSWWAPHAPEPVTLIKWLHDEKDKGTLPISMLRILHPDPPLGPDELAVLVQMTTIGGLVAQLDIMTPRQLAARGG